MKPLTAIVFANVGFWVAKCPRPYCYGAEHFGPRRGGSGVEVGNLQLDGMWCKECRTGWPVVWPTDRVEIERILMDRPDPNNRNWFPGESIYDLVAENVRHGVYSPASIEAMLRDPRDEIRSGPPTVHDEMTHSELTSLLFPGRSILALRGEML